jgi:hypothetical protein
VTKLIAELRSEHRALATVLSELKTRGLSAEGQALLNASKAALLAHLKKEDTFLYPELKRAADHDPELKEMLESFAIDMMQISKAAMEFFTTWTEGGDQQEFQQDLDLLIMALQSRIRREESLLYAAFEKLHQKTA